jgi:hypothetical protein
VLLYTKQSGDVLISNVETRRTNMRSAENSISISESIRLTSIAHECERIASRTAGE